MWEPAIPRQGGDLEDEQRRQEDDRGPGEPLVGDEGDRRIVPSAVRATWTVVAVLLALALAAGAFLLFRGPGEKQRQDAVKHVAETFAVDLSSYDFHHLDADLAKVRGMAVSRFRYDYQAIQTDSAVAKAFRDNQAISTAKVTSGPFVAAVSKHDARVLLSLVQTTRGKAQPQPQSFRRQLDIFLVNTDAGWRVDWVDFR
jgi:Mce-associated membrane protein